MLSIANYSHEGHDTVNGSNSYESPLQAIGNAMDTNNHLQKARQMIQGIYGKKNRKRDNFSIVEPNSNDFLSNESKTPIKNSEMQMKNE